MATQETQSVNRKAVQKSTVGTTKGVNPNISSNIPNERQTLMTALVDDKTSQGVITTDFSAKDGVATKVANHGVTTTYLSSKHIRATTHLSAKRSATSKLIANHGAATTNLNAKRSVFKTELSEKIGEETITTSVKQGVTTDRNQAKTRKRQNQAEIINRDGSKKIAVDKRETKHDESETMGGAQLYQTKDVTSGTMSKEQGDDDIETSDDTELLSNYEGPDMVPLHRVNTLPDNLKVGGRRISTTDDTHKLKSSTGRFNQFRRASAVFLEEMIHLNRDTSTINSHSKSQHVPWSHHRNSLRRRLSLTDLFHRKSSAKNDSEETLDETADTTDLDKDYLNQKICVWFAGSFDEARHDDAIESIYRLNGSSQNGYFASSFGHKGHAKGDFEDIKDVTILQGDRVLLTDWVLGRINMCQRNGRLLLIYTGTSFAECWASVDLGNKQIAVTSRKDHCVRIFSMKGEVLTSFGENFFQFPAGIAVDGTGHLVICDAQTDKVSVHDTTGALVRYIGNPSNPQEKFKTPRYVCVLQTGEVVVSDSGNHKIKMFTSSGKFITSFGSYGSAKEEFKFPYGVCCNRRGDIFVADHYNDRIAVFSRDGKFIRHLVTAEHGLRRPQALAMGADMKLYVSHGKMKANEVLIFDLKTRSR